MGLSMTRCGVALIVLGMLMLAGCASHYIAADKDMSRMSASELTRELAK